MNLAQYTYLDAPSAPAHSLSDPNAWISEMMEMDTDANYDWVLPISLHSLLLSFPCRLMSKRVLHYACIYCSVGACV